MEVLVRKPPTFTVEPENMYQRKISESVEMHCDAQEAEGTQKPKIQWQRVSDRERIILKRIRLVKTFRSIKSILLYFREMELHYPKAGITYTVETSQ